MTDAEMDDKFPTFKTPVSACWQCQTVLSAATGLGRYTVTPGAVSICVMCAALSLYDDNLLLRPATEQELAEIKAAAQAWARITQTRELIYDRQKQEALQRLEL